ncbi:MAG: hypothetical protein PHV33_03450 [Elusimicrobiales bacterium]|nr:hypothetical protein [Elusimicrobiales bacterium]
MKARWKRGAVLLQTLVMAIMLSMIAVMLMKWVLARYLLAARNYRATEAKARAQIVTGQQFSQWNFQDFPNQASIPSGVTMTTFDGTSVRYDRTGGATPMVFTVTIDEDPTP